MADNPLAVKPTQRLSFGNLAPTETPQAPANPLEDPLADFQRAADVPVAATPEAASPVATPPPALQAPSNPLQSTGTFDPNNIRLNFAEGSEVTYETLPYRDPLATPPGAQRQVAQATAQAAQAEAPASDVNNQLVAPPTREYEGPSLVDTDVGAKLLGALQLESPLAMLESYEKMALDDTTLDSYIDLIAAEQTQAELTRRNLNSGSRGIVGITNQLTKQYEAKARAEFNTAIRIAKVQRDKLGALTTEEGQTAQVKEETAGLFGELTAYFGGGIASGLAGTADLANMGYSAAAGEDEAFASEALSDMSKTLGDVSDTARQQQTARYQRQDTQLRNIFNADERVGSKLVKGAISMFDAEGLDYIAANAAFGAGWTLSSLLGGGVVGAGFKAVGKVAGKGAMSVGGKRAVAAVGQNVAAAKVARVVTSNGAKKLSFGAKVAAPLGASSGKEIYDQIDSALATNPDSVRSMPGWQAAKRSLELEHGRAPSDTEVDDRFKNRIAYTTTGAVSAAAFVGTVFAPATEGMLLNAAGKLVGRAAIPQTVRGAASPIAARALGGGREAVAEGFEEYVQTVAGETALRVQGAGQSGRDALAAVNDADAQLGAFIGAVVGGAGGAVAARPAPAAASAPSNSQAAAGETQDGVDTDTASPDTASSEAHAATVREGAEVARVTAPAWLAADYGVDVSDKAEFGLSGSHGPFSQTDRTARPYEPFFSDGNYALGVNPETGALGYGVNTDSGVEWRANASEVQGMDTIAAAADVIQIIASSVSGGEIDIDLAILYGRRMDVDGTSPIASAPSNPLAAPDLSIPDGVRAEQEAEAQIAAEAETYRIAMEQYRGGAFPGLMAMTEDADLSGTDAAEYVAITRARLEERVNWYASVLGDKPRLAHAVTSRMTSLPARSTGSKSVATLLNNIQEAKSDTERAAMAKRAAYGSQSSVGERAAGREIIDMLNAKDLAIRAIWIVKGKERELSPNAASQAVVDVAAADKNALLGAPANAQGLFSTLDPQAVVEPTLSQVTAEAQTPAASASIDTLRNVAIGVETEGASTYRLAPNQRVHAGASTYRLAHNQRRHLGAFQNEMKADTKSVVSRIIAQRLQAGGTFTQTLSPAARRDDIAPLDPATEARINQSVDKMLITFAARRSAEGVTADTLMFELMYVGGVSRVRALAAVEASREIDPRDAAALDRTIRTEYATNILNAVSDKVYADPVSESSMGAFVKRMNAAFQGRGLRFSYYNTEQEYAADAFDQPIPAVGAAAAFVPGRGDAPGRVFFVRNRIENEAALERIATHEVAIHYGLRNLLTEDGIADLSNQIYHSQDKGIRKIVHATERGILKARVEAARQDYTASGLPVPSNLEETVKGRLKSQPNYQAMVGEEAMAEALERGYGADDLKRGDAARLLEAVRGVFNSDTDFKIENVNDMASVIAASRQAAGGLITDRLNPNYNASIGAVKPTGYALSWFEKLRDFALDEEAPLHRIVMTARQILGRDDAGGRLEQVLDSGSGLQRSMRERMRSSFLTPMYDQLEGARAKLGMEKDTFYGKLDHYLYLTHSDERIEGLTRMHGVLSLPENQARRAQIIGEAERDGITEAELDALHTELFAMQDPALDPIVNRDPDYGQHLVGRSYRMIDEDLARLRREGFAAEIDALDLHNSETGNLRLLTESLLEHRKNSSYGASGYGRTRLLGWKQYVPMSDYEGPTNSNDEPDLMRIDGDALRPGAWYDKPIDGRYKLPSASIFSQLANTTDSVARDVVVNNMHRAIADIALTDTVVDTETGATRLKVDPRMEWLLEDDVEVNVPFAKVGRVLGAKSIKYGDGAAKIAWNPDGTATVFALKDVRTRNALTVRQADTLSENSALWKAPFRALRTGTRTFGTLLTAWNPTFVILRQFPRDLAQGMVQAGFEQNLGVGGSLKVAQKAVSVLPEMQRYFTATPVKRQAMLDGWRSDTSSPMHTFALRADMGGVTFFEDQLLNPTEDTGAVGDVAGGAFRRILGQGSTAIGNLRRYTESLSNSADNAVRQALADSIYEAEVAKISETGRTKEDILVEANDIATSMLNFGQRSTLGRNIAIIHPFAQTALTGADSILRRRIWKGGRAPVEQVTQQDGSIRTQLRGGNTLKGAWGEGGWGRELNTPMVAALGTMGIGSALAGLAAVQGMIDSDDDIGEDQFGDILRPSTMMRSYIMPASGGARPVVVAVQPGYIGLMHSVGTAAVLYANENFDKVEVTRALRDAVLYNLTPLNTALGTEMGIEDVMSNLIPTLFQPVLQYSANTNSFGNRIFTEDGSGEARGVSTLTPRLSMPRAYADLAAAVREIGEAAGVDVDPSPEVMRHWLTSYGGGIGVNIDRALKGVQATAQGDPDPHGERWLEVAGIVPADPRYAHMNTYYDLIDKHVNPMLVTEKQRAVLADRRAGAIDDKWTLSNKAAGGPAIKAFFARYGGEANVKKISKIKSSMQKNIGNLKIAHDIAITQGDTAQGQVIKEDLRKLYRSSAIELRDLLSAAGAI